MRRTSGDDEPARQVMREMIKIAMSAWQPATIQGKQKDRISGLSSDERIRLPVRELLPLPGASPLMRFFCARADRNPCVNSGPAWAAGEKTPGRRHTRRAPDPTWLRYGLKLAGSW